MSVIDDSHPAPRNTSTETGNRERESAGTGVATPAIQLDRVSFAHGRNQVLRDANLRVEPGQTVVLLGENGAGKSTLLRLCLGSLVPRTGQVQVLGREPLRHRNRLMQRVGFVPDRPDAYGGMTARAWFRFLAPHYDRWSEERIAALVDQLKVPMNTRFRNMSRGEGMKAMLVTALAHDPDVLLLDEPFGGLDPFAREDILRGVVLSQGTDRRENPRSILVTTHDLDVAQRLEDRVVMLANGSLREIDATVPRDPVSLREWVANTDGEPEPGHQEVVSCDVC